MHERFVAPHPRPNRVSPTPSDRIPHDMPGAKRVLLNDDSCGLRWPSNWQRRPYTIVEGPVRRGAGPRGGRPMRIRSSAFLCPMATGRCAARSATASAPIILLTAADSDRHHRGPEIGRQRLSPSPFRFASADGARRPFTQPTLERGGGLPHRLPSAPAPRCCWTPAAKNPPDGKGHLQIPAFGRDRCRAKLCTRYGDSPATHTR